MLTPNMTRLDLQLCFNTQFLDYPLMHLSKSVENQICSVVKLCSEKTQRAFMEACIKSMLTDMSKGRTFLFSN